MLFSVRPLNTYLRVMVLTLLAMGFYSPAHANGKMCIDFFASEAKLSAEDAFSKLEELEASLEALRSTVAQNFGKNKEQNDTLNNLLANIDVLYKKLEALQIKALEDNPLMESELQWFVSAQGKIREALANEKTEAKPADTLSPEALYELVMENPTLAKGEFQYSTQTGKGETLRFVFSEKLVAELFSDPNMASGLKKSLRKIQLGIFGTKHTGTGIIKLDNFKGMVEIRIVGGGDARLRIYGYIHTDGVIHFVTWSAANDHGSSRISAIATIVFAQREKRHTQ